MSKRKFNVLLTDKEENIEKAPRRSKRLSHLIDIDKSDDEDDKSPQTSTRINKSISRSLKRSKLAAFKKSNDTLNSSTESKASINKAESNNSMDDDEEHHALLDDQASEGEGDTPSDSTCDIPVNGESLGSSDSEKLLDESYERNSFVVSDKETELLSSDKSDLDQPKTRSKRLKIVNDDEEDDDEVKNNSKAEEQKEESEETTEDELDVIDPPSKKKWVVQKPVEEERPSISANQNSWVSKVVSSVKPSGSYFTQKKTKYEPPKIDERDFKSKMLNDPSRNKRMNMETLLRMKSKLKYLPLPPPQTSDSSDC